MLSFLSRLSKPAAAGRHGATLSALALLLWAPNGWALDVRVAGAFPGKAVVVVNGGAPRTISVGNATAEGVKLIAVDGTAATLEFDGRRHRLGVGEQAVAAATANAAASSATLTADGRGHFYANGIINGASVRFMVDTGATLVALGAGDAERAGVELSSR